HKPLEASLLQAFERAACHSPARLAFQIANIVKQPSTALENAIQLAIEEARIEFTSQAENGWIVDNAVEALIGKRWHDLIGITHHLLNFWIREQITRPGIEPCNLLRTRIEFDRDHLLSRFRRSNGRIAQASRGIQHTPHDRRDS